MIHTTSGLPPSPTPSSEDDDARIAILMSDGAAWSAQALAEHAGVSKRTVQRALAALVEAGGTTRSGQGKDVRYTRAGPVGVEARRLRDDLADLAHRHLSGGLVGKNVSKRIKGKS